MQGGYGVEKRKVHGAREASNGGVEAVENILIGELGVKMDNAGDGVVFQGVKDLCDGDGGAGDGELALVIENNHVSLHFPVGARRTSFLRDSAESIPIIRCCATPRDSSQSTAMISSLLTPSSPASVTRMTSMSLA
mgnify:CR=1 FL=1